MSAVPIRAPTSRAPYWWCLVLISVVIAVVAFSGSLSELVRRWIAQEEYSHGFFIPVIAAWLLWTRRDALLKSVGHPSWAGLALIMLAGVMLILGELSAFFMLAQLGFIVALLGIALAFGGYSFLRVALVPILTLIFAIPLPYFIDSTLSWRLQLLSSQLGVAFIRLFQVPVYLEGNVIDLGDYKLQVLEACSGLRYLYPLMSLGFLAAYFFDAPLWKRVLVFLSTIPITIAMNSLRIGIVGVSVHWWGTQMAEGFLHFFEGWIIFLACAGLLTLVIYALARIGPQGGFYASLHLPKIQMNSSTRTSAVGRNGAPLLACLLALFAAGIVNYQISSRHEIIPERPRFASFPAKIGEWRGQQGQLNSDVEHYLGVDDYLLADYVRPKGEPVNVYVAYYGSQRKGSSPHSPQVCIPGGGWQITNLQRSSYSNPAAGINLPYNRAVIEKGSDKQIVYYWFSQRGRNIANEYVSKWYLLADAVLKNRTDGALVRLTTPVGHNESDRDADERLQAFLADVVPRLSAFLPGLPHHNRTACEGSC
jgi:exosortase D (VPLPA-CTERM-specific)